MRKPVAIALLVMAIIVIIGIVGSAFAQTFGPDGRPLNYYNRDGRPVTMPYPKRQGQCGGDSVQSGGYCAPKSTTSRMEFPKGEGQCPSGFAQSGRSCQEIR